VREIHQTKHENKLNSVDFCNAQTLFVHFSPTVLTVALNAAYATVLRLSVAVCCLSSSSVCE